MEFKNKYIDFQLLSKELIYLRQHNKNSTIHNSPLFFAEAALVLLALERFLRIVPAIKATTSCTLINLLERALSPNNNIFSTPGNVSSVKLAKQISDVRNTIVHGNFEQAAVQANKKSAEEYLQTEFLAEIHTLFKLLDYFVNQVNIETGEIKKK